MKVSNFSHEGITYNFEPPIETGSRSVDTLTELIAIANMGADAAVGEIDTAQLSAHLTLKLSESSQLQTLNAILHDKHQVTVVK